MAFRAAAGRAQEPVCTVRAVHVLRRRERVAVLISADRYLHHMVRTIVGSAVEVGRGARAPAGSPTSSPAATGGAPVRRRRRRG